MVVLGNNFAFHKRKWIIKDEDAKFHYSMALQFKMKFNSCLFQPSFGSGERAAVVVKEVAKLSLGKKGGMGRRHI